MQSQLQNEEDALNTAKAATGLTCSRCWNSTGPVRGTTHTADGAPTALAAIDQELDSLRAKLVDLSSRYTDRYPDVLRVKDEIAKTEKRRDDLPRRTEGQRQWQQAGDPGMATDPSQSTAAMQLQVSCRPTK